MRKGAAIGEAFIESTDETLTGPNPVILHLETSTNSSRLDVWRRVQIARLSSPHWRVREWSSPRRAYAYAPWLADAMSSLPDLAVDRSPSNVSAAKSRSLRAGLAVSNPHGGSNAASLTWLLQRITASAMSICSWSGRAPTIAAWRWSGTCLKAVAQTARISSGDSDVGERSPREAIAGTPGCSNISLRAIGKFRAADRLPEN
jgi:hypothetical protein